jgi:hypothetical protein
MISRTGCLLILCALIFFFLLPMWVTCTVSPFSAFSTCSGTERHECVVVSSLGYRQPELRLMITGPFQ